MAAKKKTDADTGAAHADCGDAGANQTAEFFCCYWIHNETPLEAFWLNFFGR